MQQYTGFRTMDYEEWLARIKATQEEDAETLEEDALEYTERTQGSYLATRHTDRDQYRGWKAGKKLAPPPIAETRNPIKMNIATGNAARLQRRSQYQWTCSQCGAAQTLLEATTAERLRCRECGVTLHLEGGTPCE